MKRPTFMGLAVVPDDTRQANRQHAHSLGLRVLASYKPKPGPLAVVGGAPTVAEHIETLRQWPGEIWAINGMAAWLAAQGIEATFFTLDPGKMPADHFDGIKRALLVSESMPETFSMLAERGIDTTIFDVGAGQDECAHNGTSASGAPVIAIRVGITDVTFFGCAGSYRAGEFNIYHDHDNTLGLTMVIRAANGIFLTCPEFMNQAEAIATVISEFPTIFKEKSGGLLSAMLADPDWQVIAYSPKLRAMMDEQKPIFDKARETGKLDTESLHALHEKFRSTPN